MERTERFIGKFGRALFLWAIVFLGSIALAEIPAVGNRAVLLVTETGGDADKVLSLSHELVAYNLDRDEFTIERSDNGKHDRWMAPKENLATRSELESKLRRCRSRGGTLIPAHQVQAGVFPACRFSVVSEDGEGEYFTGVVPFGMLEFSFRTHSGITTRYELFDYNE